MSLRSPLVLRRCLPPAPARRLRLSRRHGYATAAASPELYDLVCVGGGPAGLSLLTGLRANPITAHLRMALVDAQDLERNKLPADASPDTFSNRCSSLTPASVQHLQDIGAWDHLNHARLQPYHEMHVWDGVTDSRISFDWDHSASRSRTIAYMAENVNITTALLNRLQTLSSPDLFTHTRVSSISLGPSDPPADSSPNAPDLSLHPHLTLHPAHGPPTTIAARLLVGADGPNSPVRHFSGITSRGWPYHRVGVVATLNLHGPGGGDATHRIAYQRFLPTGPLAMLPLPGHAATIVWSTTPSRAELLQQLPGPAFATMIDAGFRLSPAELDYLHSLPPSQVAEDARWRLRLWSQRPSSSSSPAPEARRLPPRVHGVQPHSTGAFPLRLSHADAYTGARVALLGDAAHTIHPLAGQGLNQGQADAQALVETVVAAVRAGRDVGSAVALENYAARRYAANHVMLGVCDKLHKLFSVGGGPVAWVRGAGMRVVDALPGVKRGLMGAAAVGGGGWWSL